MIIIVWYVIAVIFNFVLEAPENAVLSLRSFVCFV